MGASINFVGDIGLFKKYEDAGIDPFAKIKLPSANYAIANFEFVQPTDFRDKAYCNVEDNYKCSYKFFKSLDINRFNAYGLANNHVMDYGKPGIEDMTDVFNDKGVAWFGVSSSGEDRLLEFSVNGIDFIVVGGVSAGRWSKNLHGFGPEPLDNIRITNLINANKEKCHHIIIFLHWGTELVDIPPSNNVLLAKQFIDAGASAVIGHHPHVPQGIQKYKNGIIAYSLGSFIFMPDQVPAYEPGYIERDLSIVLNVEFSRERIQKVNTVYYRYNPRSLIPEQVKLAEIESYVSYINDNVENNKDYTSKVRRLLLKRELKLFVKRIKSNPISTIAHYSRYLSLRHLKKIVGL